MATMWIALVTETVVVTAAAGALTSWIRRSKPNTGEDQIVEPSEPAQLV